VLPLSGINARTDFTISGHPPATATDTPAAQDRWVSPGYFHTMQIQLVEGRDFSEADDERGAGVALLLATAGLYAVLSYSVMQRTHEIGIRMALGANMGELLRMIIQQGLKLASTGIALGLLASLALTRLMSSLLFGVGASDPLTIAGVAALLAAVALLASCIPAWRATRVDPMVALRRE